MSQLEIHQGFQGRQRKSSRMGYPTVATMMHRTALARTSGKTEAQRYNQALIRDAVWKILSKEGNQSPLEYLLTEMNNKTREDEFRLECARIAAPFVHSKMPILVETDMPDAEERAQRMFANAQLLEGLSDAELATLTGIAAKLKSAGVEGGAGETEAVEAEFVLPSDGTPQEGTLPEAPGVLRSGSDSP